MKISFATLGYLVILIRFEVFSFKLGKQFKNFVQTSKSLLGPLEANPSGKWNSIPISRAQKQLPLQIDTSKRNPLEKPRRRKAGSRNGQSRDQQLTTGRVSVYCVGSALDLQALRTHVFRRGFGNSPRELGMATNDTTIELVLARGPEEQEIIGDDVLHVSNAPLFITADKSMRYRTADEDWSPSASTDIVESVESTPYNSESSDVSDDEWKTREMLLMVNVKIS